MKNTIVVNLFGAPGAGKSTGAAYIFSKLKAAGVNAEYVPEFIKDKIWERSEKAINNQAYIFGKQYFRLQRLIGEVDVIVTDSPLINSAYYNNNPILGENFNRMVFDVFNSFKNYNYFIQRVKSYNPDGRFQNEEESDAIAKDLKLSLINSHVDYKGPYNGDDDGYNAIFNEILDIWRNQPSI